MITVGKGCPNPNFCWAQTCLGKCNMIDDSLSDTQQEKKMSVKELKLKTQKVEAEIKNVSEGVLSLAVIENNIECLIFLDRNQAHMLMLYLQEHLGYVSISKDRLNET